MRLTPRSDQHNKNRGGTPRCEGAFREKPLASNFEQRPPENYAVPPAQTLRWRYSITSGHCV